MDRHELVGLTIDRLFDHFRLSPESFEYFDQNRNPSKNCHPTIVWTPKVELNEYTSAVQDPYNNHAVVVTWNSLTNELVCYIFMKAPIDLNGAKADYVMSSKRWFEKWRRNYRRFRQLGNLIIDREQYKENMTYLRKLSSVFPDTFDDKILKD